MRQVQKPVLQEMNAQHALQPNRWAACAFRLGIKRLDHLAQVSQGIICSISARNWSRRVGLR